MLTAGSLVLPGSRIQVDLVACCGEMSVEIVARAAGIPGLLLRNGNGDNWLRANRSAATPPFWVSSRMTILRGQFQFSDLADGRHALRRVGPVPQKRVIHCAL